MVAKWANLAGQVGYVLDLRRRGRMARLIEYKRVDAGEPASPGGEDRP